MTDYISKEIAIERIKRVKPHCVMSEYGVGYERGLKDAIGLLNATPAADVQPVKRGRWESEHYNELMECYEATCSECGYESTDKYHITDSHRFCENCGADMTGGTDND